MKKFIKYLIEKKKDFIIENEDLYIQNLQIDEISKALKCGVDFIGILLPYPNKICLSFKNIA